MEAGISKIEDYLAGFERIGCVCCVLGETGMCFGGPGRNYLGAMGKKKRKGLTNGDSSCILCMFCFGRLAQLARAPA